MHVRIADPISNASRTILGNLLTKGYHKAQTLCVLEEEYGLRTYVPEPERKHQRNWTDKPAAQKQAVYNNRRRVKREKGRLLQRRRSERVERSFAHLCNSGGMRRSWLTGMINVTKRYLMAAAAHNLGRLMRMLCRIGKPKALQGLAVLIYLLQLVLRPLQQLERTSRINYRSNTAAI